MREGAVADGGQQRGADGRVGDSRVWEYIERPLGGRVAAILLATDEVVSIQFDPKLVRGDGLLLRLRLKQRVRDGREFALVMAGDLARLH